MNRTRASSMATTNSTTRPMMLVDVMVLHLWHYDRKVWLMYFNASWYFVAGNILSVWAHNSYLISKDHREKPSFKCALRQCRPLPTTQQFTKPIPWLVMKPKCSINGHMHQWMPLNCVLSKRRRSDEDRKKKYRTPINQTSKRQCHRDPCKHTTLPPKIQQNAANELNAMTHIYGPAA